MRRTPGPPRFFVGNSYNKGILISWVCLRANDFAHERMVDYNSHIRNRWALTPRTYFGVRLSL